MESHPVTTDGQVPSWSLVTGALARLKHPGKSVILQTYCSQMDGYESHLSSILCICLFGMRIIEAEIRFLCLDIGGFACKSARNLPRTEV